MSHSFCPPDDSVLLFERRTDQNWHLLLNFDNTDFKKPYGDRELLYADVSPRDDNGQFYVFIARTRSYCPSSGSVWNNINYHVLRPGADPESPRVILSAEHEYREDNDCRIVLEKDALTMDFPASSITLTTARTYILSYAIGENGARRIEPLAASAEGFVEEWVASPWSFASKWSEPARRRSLRTWHERLDAGKRGRYDLLGDSVFRQVCSVDHELIQISLCGISQRALLTPIRSFSWCARSDRTDTD